MYFGFLFSDKLLASSSQEMTSQADETKKLIDDLATLAGISQADIERNPEPGAYLQLPA